MKTNYWNQTGETGRLFQRLMSLLVKKQALTLDNDVHKLLITFHVCRRRREMYCITRVSLSACLYVCLSVRGRTPTLLHGREWNLGSGRGCPLVVHYWADLQSRHGLGSYGNTTRTRKTMPIVFSERELTFTFAICCRPSVCLSVCRLSVVCLSVTLVHPTQAVQIFGNISTAFGTLAIRWHPLKISRRSSHGNPSAWGVKHKRGSKI